jgi:predicted SAM-dependent methyltransferase
MSANASPVALKLHLGCGSKYIPGFEHIDSTHHRHLSHCADVSHLPMYGDGTVDLIYASHVLEHFGRQQYPVVLREWYRLLRPGGVLRLGVPDFAAVAALYYEQGLVDGLTGLVGLVSGGQRDASDYHKMIFDEALLGQALLEAGFSAFRRWDWRSTEHAQIDDYSQAYLPHLDKQNGRLMSLNLEGIK